LYFGVRVAVLNNFIYQTGVSINVAYFKLVELVESLIEFGVVIQVSVRRED
jgi:hypothetical protein